MCFPRSIFVRRGVNRCQAEFHLGAKSYVSKDVAGKMTWGICENTVRKYGSSVRARGIFSFVVCRIVRNISVWKYLLLSFFSGVTREMWRTVGSFICLAHSYVDWFRYPGGAIFVCVHHIEIVVITLVITPCSFYTTNTMIVDRCVFPWADYY